MSKPRSDAKLLNLPPKVEDQICDWLNYGIDGDTKYETVREKIYEKFNIRTSVGALYEFYRQIAAPRRLAKAAAAAGNLKEEASARGAHFKEASLAVLQQKGFEILAQQHTDPKELVAFFGMILDADRLAIDKQKVELQRDRFEFSAAKAALKHVRELKIISSDKSLNEEAKIEAVRERLFGKAPGK